MKNIILLITVLFLSLIGCTQSTTSDLNILNKGLVPMRIQQDGKTVLELAVGGCVNFATQDEFLTLTIQENDTRGLLGIYQDDYICSNDRDLKKQNLSSCKVGKKSIIVKQAGGFLAADYHVLVEGVEEAKKATLEAAGDDEEAKAEAEKEKYSFSKCKPLKEEAAAAAAAAVAAAAEDKD